MPWIEPVARRVGWSLLAALAGCAASAPPSEKPGSPASKTAALTQAEPRAVRVVFDPATALQDADPRPTDFDADDGRILVLLADNIFDASARRRLLIEPERDLSQVRSFGGRTAVWSQGRVRFVQAGRLTDLFELPQLAGVRMAADGEVLYIAGKQPDGRGAVFAATSDGLVVRLFTTDAPVDALGAGGGRVCFSVGPAVYTFKQGERVRPAATLAAVRRITSLAPSADGSAVFLSDGVGVYRLDLAAGALSLVFADLGGELRCRDGKLLLLLEGDGRVLSTAEPGPKESP